MDGVWFCFYSKFQERLDEPQINHNMEEFKKIHFPAQLQEMGKQHPKEFQGYIHICWSDYLPKSGGFMGLKHPPSFWRVMMMKPVGNVEMPNVYDLIAQ